jgi:hypothetical protein
MTILSTKNVCESFGLSRFVPRHIEANQPTFKKKQCKYAKYLQMYTCVVRRGCPHAYKHETLCNDESAMQGRQQSRDCMLKMRCTCRAHRTGTLVCMHVS